MCTKNQYNNAMRIEHLKPEKNEPRLERFTRTVEMGFNGGEISDVELSRTVGLMVDNNADVTEVFTDGSTNPDPKMTAAPEGTFATFEGTVNLGTTPIRAAEITAVSVRPTSKRQGILRAMMTDNLDRVADEGYRVALLTASSAALYGRFGFKNVVEVSTVKIHPYPRFALRDGSTENVHMVSMEWLFPQMPAIFEAFHKITRGSVSRFEGFYGLSKYLDDAGKPDPKYRGAIHCDEQGAIDGYVVYSITDETKLAIKDFITLTPVAEIALWAFLGSIECLDEIRWDGAPKEWLLPEALVDRRVIRIESQSDALWARVLDAHILENRPYGTDGIFGFSVDDPLGYASGDFQLEVCDGIGTVTEAKGGPKVSVQALAALAFGSTAPSTLAAVGLMDSDADLSLQNLDALFSPQGLARFDSWF